MAILLKSKKELAEYRRSFYAPSEPVAPPREQQEPEQAAAPVAPSR